MAKWRLKKEQTVGGIAAETDDFLLDCFIDLDYKSLLEDTQSSKFILL